MRRCLIVLVVAAVTVSLCAPVLADTKTKTETKKKSLWEFGGGVRLGGVMREKAFDQLFNRSGNPRGRAEFYIDALLTLSLNIQISSTTNLFVQLETVDDAYAGESHRIGDNNQIATFEQGWLKVEEIFGGSSVDMALKLGLMDLRFDTRNLGRDAFLLDVRESENPLTGLPILTARANGTPSNQGHVSPYVVASYDFSRNESFGGNAWVHQYTGQFKRSEAGGAMLTFNFGKDVLVDLGAMMIMEGGLGVKDTFLYFLNFDFEFDLSTQEKGIKKGESFDDQSLINVLACVFQGEHCMVADVGLGLDLLIDIGRSAQVELYGECHYQYGGKYYTETDFTVVPADRELVRHEAYGAYGGFRFKILDDGNMQPYLDVSYWRLSGDRGDINEENQDFMSMENVDSTLILEGNEYGFDIDCNYWAIKAEIGFRLPSSLNSITVRISGGAFWLLKAPKDIVSTTLDTVSGEYQTYSQAYQTSSRKNLGYEIDLYVTWEVSDEAKIFIAGGALQDSAFLKNVSELHGADSPRSNTFLVLGGLELKF